MLWHILTSRAPPRAISTPEQLAVYQNAPSMRVLYCAMRCEELETTAFCRTAFRESSFERPPTQLGRWLSLGRARGDLSIRNPEFLIWAKGKGGVSPSRAAIFKK